MAKIDFKAKTDRELLVLVAQQGNDNVDHLARINSSIEKHESRITDLEGPGCCNPLEPKWKSKLKVNWQTLTLLSSIIALILLELSARI